MSVADGNGGGARDTRDARDVTDARRWPIAAVLLVLLVAALIAGNGDDEAESATQAPREASDAAALSLGDARSTAWYCQGPPPTPLLSETAEVVNVANVGEDDADVADTVLPDNGRVVRRSLSVPRRSAVDAAPDGNQAEQSALIVEPFAARVFVDATNAGASRLTTAPCLTQPSSEWHFAAGTTVRGAEQWLVLFNPFGDDAVVDMSFFTEDGLERPGGLQGYTVPRRSRVAIPVHFEVRRQESVATAVTARTGRIVAQQTLVFAPESQRSGETRSIGAVAPANEWVFPSGRTAAGSVRTIGISNPGELDAEVDVSVAPVGDIAIEPATVRIPRRSVANVRIGACGERRPPACIPVPADTGYSVVVRATLDVPVVAEDLVTFTTGRFTGTAGGPGSHEPAREWVIARSRARDQLDAGLDLLTTGSSPATVDMSFIVGGEELRPRDLQGLELRPGVRSTVALGGREDLQDLDAAIVVRADRPVVAERTMVREDELTRDLAIPVR